MGGTIRSRRTVSKFLSTRPVELAIWTCCKSNCVFKGLKLLTCEWPADDYAIPTCSREGGTTQGFFFRPSKEWTVVAYRLASMGQVLAVYW